jgi:hypothetical protein
MEMALEVRQAGSRSDRGCRVRGRSGDQRPLELGAYCPGARAKQSRKEML